MENHRGPAEKTCFMLEGHIEKDVFEWYRQKAEEGKEETIQVKKNLVKDIVEKLNRQGRGVVMNEIEFKSLEKLGQK